MAREVYGRPPLAYVDFAQTRVQGLLSAASPHDMDLWAAQDVAERARALRAVTRLMLGERRGRCLFVSSIAAATPAPGQGLYAAAKAAGESLFATAGLELAPRGISTVSLRLGLVDAGRGREHMRGHKEHCAALQPSGTLVRVADVVETLLFLLCESAWNMNATVLTLDGGASTLKGAWLASRALQKAGT